MWDDQAMALEREEALKIGASEKEQWTALLRLCKTNFGEVFQCAMHLKSLRIYVESVLRYGLPANFQPLILKFPPKNERKVKEALYSHFDNLNRISEKKTMSVDNKQIEENLVTMMGEKDYSPVVFFNVATPQ